MMDKPFIHAVPDREDLSRASIVYGAPPEAAESVAASVRQVIAGLPKGEGRPAFGVEPATFLVAMRSCRR